MTDIALIPLDLILRDEDEGQGCKFILDHVECWIENINGHSLFTAGTATFAIALCFPGYYLGESTGTPVYIVVQGDHLAGMRWLPVDPNEKRAIIKRLPLDE